MIVISDETNPAGCLRARRLEPCPTQSWCVSCSVWEQTWLTHCLASVKSLVCVGVSKKKKNFDDDSNKMSCVWYKVWLFLVGMWFHCFLWRHINVVCCCCQVFHGADSDIEWLQKDFGLYVVNLFDTHQASRALHLARNSLDHLLKHFCNVDSDKRYQLADWRIRFVDHLFSYFLAL